VKLAELQGLFWRSVRFDPMPPELEEHFLDQGALAARARMKLYQDGYWFRQVDALFECFPRLADALGAEVFTRTVCRYLTEHPSRAPMLERLGAQLGPFLARQQDPAVAALADLASLEHARMEVLIAPQPRAIAAASDIDPETFALASIEPSPALQLLRLRRDAVSRWEASCAASAPALDNALAQVAVWRKGHTLHQQILDEDEAQALDLALRQASIAEIFDCFAEHPTPERRAFQALTAWLQRHWICSFLPPPSP
jgi:hypothetical protein